MTKELLNQGPQEKLAYRLLNLFWNVGIVYLPGYESWARHNSSKNTLVLPRYSIIIKQANIFLLKLTRKKSTKEEIKELLIIIEKWVLQSSENVFQIEYDGRLEWCPAIFFKKSRINHKKQVVFHDK